MNHHKHPAARFTEPGAWRWGVRYGAMGYPLAFVALPLYVLLPNHYAVVLGAPLAGLGAVLLGTRAVDAIMDPWIGRVGEMGVMGDVHRDHIRHHIRIADIAGIIRHRERAARRLQRKGRMA